jgi:hypothetical protein
LAQQAAAVSGDESAAITGKSKPVKSTRHSHLKSGQAGTECAARTDPAEKVTPDLTHGGTTGAAGGIAPSPVKVDPEVHNLNTILPP